jgi:hypothetical protein
VANFELKHSQPLTRGRFIFYNEVQNLYQTNWAPAILHGLETKSVHQASAEGHTGSTYRMAMEQERANADPPEETKSAETSSDEPLYVISVAAKLVRMPAWTLRVLDEQGIVVPRRTDKKRRLYSDRDLFRLTRVRTLTEEEGVNMNGVRLILKLEADREKGDGI